MNHNTIQRHRYRVRSTGIGVVALLAGLITLGTFAAVASAQQRVITRQRTYDDARRHTLVHQRVYQDPDRLRVHQGYHPSWRPHFERHWRSQAHVQQHYRQQRWHNARVSPPRVDHSTYRVRQDNPNSIVTRYRNAPPVQQQPETVERPAVDRLSDEPSAATEGGDAR